MKKITIKESELKKIMEQDWRQKWEPISVAAQKMRDHQNLMPDEDDYDTFVDDWGTEDKEKYKQDVIKWAEQKRILRKQFDDLITQMDDPEEDKRIRRSEWEKKRNRRIGGI